MVRRPSLTDAGVTRPSQALPPPALPPAAADVRRPPAARREKKAVAFGVDPSASVQLRTAVITMGSSVQAIMAEALDDWFGKQGLHRLTGGGSGK